MAWINWLLFWHFLSSLSLSRSVWRKLMKFLSQEPFLVPFGIVVALLPLHSISFGFAVSAMSATKNKTNVTVFNIKYSIVDILNKTEQMHWILINSLSGIQSHAYT